MSDFLKKRQQFILDGRPLPEKKNYSIPKKSAKRIEKEKEQKKAQGKDGSPLDQWFAARRLEMTGRCCLCNGKSEKHNDATFKRSIHHLFEKRKTMFPSVALNEDNWLELCAFGNSCHQNIHNGTITWELLHDSAEWEIILAKVKKVFPFIHENEKKNIPEILLKSINK
jgi:hypothetical protein